VVTAIQQVLFEVEGQYLGHPYFVTGNALYNALAGCVDDAVRRSVAVSHGVFVPGEYGEYPPRHSRSGYAGKLGLSLPEVAAYDDLFVFRDAAHRWLLDSRPRAAHNALDLVTHGGRVAFAPTCWFGRRPELRDHRRSMSWYLHCYLHTDGNGHLPIDADVLDGIRVGGARNYGFGELSVADTQVVDLDDLDYSRLEAVAEGDGRARIELVTPYVTASAYPGADAQSIPWWWQTEARSHVPGDGDSGGGLRRRETRLVDDGDAYVVSVVDHGQVVEYAGSDVVGTARNGVLRVGTHSRYGFGEFRVRPPGEDRVTTYVDDDVVAAGSGVDG
jgi:hypothetical protein